MLILPKSLASGQAFSSLVTNASHCCKSALSDQLPRQAFYPDVWVTSQSVDSYHATRSMVSGDIISSTTDLTPFYNDAFVGTYWTSDSSRDFSKMEYTYPEFVGAASNADVQARVQQLYGFSGTATAKRSDASVANVALRVRHYDWSVILLTLQTILILEIQVSPCTVFSR